MFSVYGLQVYGLGLRFTGSWFRGRGECRGRGSVAPTNIRYRPRHGCTAT